MNILIIGGTGYMGRITVRLLLDRGDDVTVFSRGTSKPEWWDRVEHIQGDREDREDFEAKLKGKPEMTRFKGLGEISPSEFGQFIGAEKRLITVNIDRVHEVQETLSFFMGQNTPERRAFIMENLR